MLWLHDYSILRDLCPKHKMFHPENSHYVSQIIFGNNQSKTPKLKTVSVELHFFSNALFRAKLQNLFYQTVISISTTKFLMIILSRT